jgi:hypothetical protein
MGFFGLIHVIELNRIKYLTHSVLFCWLRDLFGILFTASFLRIQ